MSEKKLPAYDISFSPEQYLPILAPDILESVPLKKKDRFFVEFKRLYHMIAHDMVRYAIKDRGSYSDWDDVVLNEETGQPYSLGDLGFDAESLAGDTAGSFINRDIERVQHIPLIAIALYRLVSK